MTCFNCPTSQIIDPPTVVFRDFYHPQIVNIIHPVEIVNRHHCVPVPNHITTFTVREEFCPTPAVATAGIRSVKRTSKKRR